ncbi:MULTISPECIES: hypothetical protein [Halorussus]|uniref:Nmad3 family putative nucleotide modification protein n=1 Tax=Halorussus TaxID=1070314 RepID=UPI000E2165B8|nr:MULTISPECIES: hypothetical protein [Halorussus]NHN60475.1 hypothetical protein [Halorussus sp. JP-T4]
MSVVLVGIAADSDNTSNCPPIFEDGTFEYIPIPEQYETTETATYHSEGFSEYLSHVVHREQETTTFDEVPIHHDPNFETLTFGDPGKSRSKLLSLSEDDVLGFYCGLTPPGYSRPKHRYLIGYFTVDRVIDFNSLREAEIENEVENNRENAHIKRYLASRDPRHLSDLVIVQGKQPGGQLDEAIKLSGGRPDASNYYFREKWIDAWEPSTEYLGGIKPVITAAITKNQFLNSIQ